jgi:hypothetical protein
MENIRYDENKVFYQIILTVFTPSESSQNVLDEIKYNFINTTREAAGDISQHTQRFTIVSILLYYM